MFSLEESRKFIGYPTVCHLCVKTEINSNDREKKFSTKTFSKENNSNTELKILHLGVFNTPTLLGSRRQIKQSI